MRAFFSRALSVVRSLHLPPTFVLIVYPVILSVLAYFYACRFGIGMFEILLAVCTYYVINITVGVGMHRYWSHNAFSLNRAVQFILMVLSSATLQGPILMWASNHAKHHMYTDTPRDPHSPMKFNGGIKGFLWAHIGWMLFKTPRDMDKGTMKRLGRDPMLQFQFKHYWWLAVLTNTLIPLAVGFLLRPSLCGAAAGFIFMGLGRAVQQHGTFCVNSVTHYFGERRYELGGSAGDIFWMAPFLLGENWHSFHHAFPSDYRNGVELYHFDVHKWIIWLLERFGLASDVKRTSELRIIAQRKLVLSNAFHGINKRLSDIKASVVNLGLCKSDKLQSYLHRYDSILSALSSEISKVLCSEHISKRVIREASSLLAMFEKTIRKLERAAGVCSMG